MRGTVAATLDDVKWWPCLFVVACRAPDTTVTAPPLEVRAEPPADAAPPPVDAGPLDAWGLAVDLPDGVDTRMIDDRTFLVSFGGTDEVTIARRDGAAPARADELATAHGGFYVVRRAVRFEGSDSVDGEIIEFRAETLEVHAILPVDDAHHASCRGRLSRTYADAGDERELDRMTAICTSLRQK